VTSQLSLIAFFCLRGVHDRRKSIARTECIKESTVYYIIYMKLYNMRQIFASKNNHNESLEFLIPMCGTGGVSQMSMHATTDLDRPIAKGLQYCI